MHRLILTLALLLTVAPRIPAQITADIAVSQVGGPLGTITVELDHVNAPMATANFIGLASGKLSWIDSATGVVRHNTPYYDGIIFHRVIDGFMNQTGSQNGLGTDGPGYSFQDGMEITNGLDHSEPYVISMANSGPNTNGSQFFLTVEPATHLDGKHIVFGKVTASGNSRNVVNQINNLPTDAGDRPVDEIKIDSVTVNYNGVNFGPTAQGLPVVSTPNLSPLPGPSSTSLIFDQPAGSTFHLAYSDGMADWQRSSARTLDIDDSPLSSFSLPNGARYGVRMFYSPALVTYDPDFYFPSSLANRTFTVVFNPTAPITFVFDATGQSAAWTYRTLSGTATIYSPYTHTHYGGFVILELPTLQQRFWQFDDMFMTAVTPTEVSGKHNVAIWMWNPATERFEASNSPGTFTLTK